MKSTRRITIKLPPLPTAWNKLTSREMEEVHRLMVKRQVNEVQYGEEKAGNLFKFDCFILFTGLKVLKRTSKDEKGDTVFFFRRRGWRYLFERIPMRSWQITQWIGSSLQFLDDPYRRTVCPYAYIRLYGKKLKAPSDLMTNLTHQQYTVAQNMLTLYWQAASVADSLEKKGGSREAVREQQRRIKQAKCRFLSALFTPSSLEVEVRTESSVRRVRRRVWAFEMAQVTANEWRFRRPADRMFPVMLQFFQSVQMYYSRIFPDLFTSSKSGKGKDYLLMEAETMNAVMKYAGFTGYQDIYDSNAFFILGVLNNMSKEAKQIEEMNRKMKAKK